MLNTTLEFISYLQAGFKKDPVYRTEGAPFTGTLGSSLFEKINDRPWVLSIAPKVLRLLEPWVPVSSRKLMTDPGSV